ncbi:MAG: membrane-binding protein [Capnocytophaga sp.]|nr:membrane-binding protein [Capnocytophaga sp.]
MAKSYANRIVDLQLLIDGLKEIKDALPAGITEESIVKLESYKVELESLNSKQEQAKALLKEITDNINKKSKEIDKVYADARKRIKMDVSNVLWRKFGIEDKR